MGVGRKQKKPASVADQAGYACLPQKRVDDQVLRPDHGKLT